MFRCARHDAAQPIPTATVPQLFNGVLQVNALTPSLDASSLEVFEVLVRGSAQQLRHNVKHCNHEPHSAHSDEDILDIDDNDCPIAAGTADAHSSHADDRPVSAVVAISDNSDLGSDIDDDSDIAIRRRPARTAAPVKRYAPPRFIPQSAKKRRVLRHDDECFLCNDGGELVTCDVCPHVYHLDCVGLKAMPKGVWRCPWHSCNECEKSSSKAEGVLFHCMTCPLTYCFECAPDRYTVTTARWSALAERKSEYLQSRGMDCPKSYRFFLCSDCVDDNRERALPKLKQASKPRVQPALPASIAANKSNNYSAKQNTLNNYLVKQSVPSSEQAVRLQEQMRFFKQMSDQSVACRVQLLARLAALPPDSDQSKKIGLQMQQLQKGEVHNAHMIMQIEQQMLELANTGVFHSSDAAAAADTSTVPAAPPAHFLEKPHANSNPVANVISADQQQGAASPCSPPSSRLSPFRSSRDAVGQTVSKQESEPRSARAAASAHDEVSGNARVSQGREYSGCEYKGDDDYDDSTFYQSASSVDRASAPSLQDSASAIAAPHAVLWSQAYLDGLRHYEN